MSTILADFQPHHVSLFGEHILQLKHRLAESALFTDAALARLIEKTPAAHLYVNTMDRRSHNPRSRREGAIDGLSGAEALEAVRSGNIWINIHKLGETDSGLRRSARRHLSRVRRARAGAEDLQALDDAAHLLAEGEGLLSLRRARADALADARREARLRLSEHGAVPDPAGDGEDRARRVARDRHALRSLVRRLCRGDRPRSRRDALLAAQLPAPRRQPRLPERLHDDRALDRRAAERLCGELRERHHPPHISDRSICRGTPPARRSGRRRGLPRR